MMQEKLTKTATLLLEDGTVYQGKAIGLTGTTGGEICFNTGMTGYQEVYTDPSYYGQIIVNTASHIGNYGTAEREQESEGPKISGLIVNIFSQIHSRQSADASLQDYLTKHKVVGISNLDTRAIVKHIRSKGAMNAVISSEDLSIEEIQKKVKEVPSMANLELSSQVYTKESYLLGNENNKYKIAVLDLGIKKSILKNFISRNAYCRVFPGNTSLKEMESWEPDAYFISNGPGDPAATSYAVETVKGILDLDKPLFGICLGHQILALAKGISTYKMHHGHRGLNHPVKNLESGHSEVTSQNHGFAVDENEIKKSKDVLVTHKNLNDDTVEGLKIKGKKAFSVQYHPESTPGPNDSIYLFDQFIEMIANQ